MTENIYNSHTLYEIPPFGKPKYWDYRRRNYKPNEVIDLKPSELWSLACDYFAYTDANPEMKTEAIKNGTSAGTILEIPVKKPYTWTGLGSYITAVTGAGGSLYLRRIRKNKDGIYNCFQRTLLDIDDVIQDGKYSGAVTGIYNPSIISKDLGLVEKSEVKEVQEQPIFVLGSDNTEKATAVDQSSEDPISFSGSF